MDVLIWGPTQCRAAVNCIPTFFRVISKCTLCNMTWLTSYEHGGCWAHHKAFLPLAVDSIWPDFCTAGVMPRSAPSAQLGVMLKYTPSAQLESLHLPSWSHTEVSPICPAGVMLKYTPSVQLESCWGQPHLPIWSHAEVNSICPAGVILRSAPSAQLESCWGQLHLPSWSHAEVNSICPAGVMLRSAPSAQLSPICPAGVILRSTPSAQLESCRGQLHLPSWSHAEVNSICPAGVMLRSPPSAQLGSCWGHLHPTNTCPTTWPYGHKFGVVPCVAAVNHPPLHQRVCCISVQCNHCIINTTICALQFLSLLTEGGQLLLHWS